MGAERRRQVRTPCSIPCAVQGQGKPVEGTVRDISAGGLSVQVDLPVEQGDVLTLTLQPDPRTRIEVQAIVWHDRRGRMKNTGKAVRRLGLVLSEAPEAFSELLSPQKSPSLKPRSKRSAAPARPVPPKPASLLKAERYRVRVKQDSGVRTRSILVFAQDDDEARKFALEETGAGWHILEVDRA